jgi:hypothetical protein
VSTGAVFVSTCDADGKWHIERNVRAAMTAHVSASMKNSVVEIVVRKKANRRSDRANRYYWGVVLAEICSCAGYRRKDAEQLHDALAHKFLPLPPCPITGSPRRQRTPETDTAEFGVYLEEVIQWAAETWGVVIPEPTSVEPPQSADGRSPRRIDREHGWGVSNERGAADTAPVT